MQLTISFKSIATCYRKRIVSILIIYSLCCSGRVFSKASEHGTRILRGLPLLRTLISNNKRHDSWKILWWSLIDWILRILLCFWLELIEADLRKYFIDVWSYEDRILNGFEGFRIYMSSTLYCLNGTRYCLKPRRYLIILVPFKLCSRLFIVDWLLTGYSCWVVLHFQLLSNIDIFAFLLSQNN